MQTSAILRPRSFLFTSLAVSLVLAFSGCSLPFRISPIRPAVPQTTEQAAESTASKATVIALPSEGLTLNWDYPLDENPVSVFQVGYADANAATREWVVLSEAPAGAILEFDIDASSIPQGDWIIGIKAVDADGNVSDWHSSLSADAIPSNGWILRKA